MSDLEEYNIHCLNCVRYDPPSEILVHGNKISIVRHRNNNILTCNDSEIIDKIYLRNHIDDEKKGFKDFQMFCNQCTNQVGIVINIDGLLVPAFQQDSIVMKDEMGNHMNGDDWRRSYCQHYGVIENVERGSEGNTEYTIWELVVPKVKQSVELLKRHDKQEGPKIVWNHIDDRYVVQKTHDRIVLQSKYR